MDNTGKILIGIGVLFVGVYIFMPGMNGESRYSLWKKNPTDSKPVKKNSPMPMGDSAYKTIIIPKGSTFKNATIIGFDAVRFQDDKQNQFDSGIRTATLGDYDITAVVDRSKEQPPVGKPFTVISGFPVTHGTIVNIGLVKDVKASIPTQAIIMT